MNILERLREKFNPTPADPLALWQTFSVPPLHAGVTWDVLEFCQPEMRDDEQRLWYAFTPDVIYPATIERILEVLDTGEYPRELSDLMSVAPEGVANIYLEQAKGLTCAGLEYATADREFTPDAYLQERAAALNLARLWFTQALIVRVGASIGVHIGNDPAYKL